MSNKNDQLKQHRFNVGDRVFMKKYPNMPCVVMKLNSTVRTIDVYQLRFEANTDDTRGYLIWDDAII